MAKEEGKSGPQVLNLSQLNLPQLDQLKTQLEEVNASDEESYYCQAYSLWRLCVYVQEGTLLTTSMAQLKLVQQKLRDSKKAVSTTTKDGLLIDRHETTLQVLEL